MILMEPSGPVPSLFTQSGRDGSRPTAGTYFTQSRYYGGFLLRVLAVVSYLLLKEARICSDSTKSSGIHSECLEAGDFVKFRAVFR